MHERSARLGRVVDVSMIVAAVVIATTVVVRELRGPRQATQARDPANEYMPEWEQLLSVGLWIGERTAPVRVVVFSDLECPACRQFHGQLLRASPLVRASVVLVVVHFPLPQHRFARIAARALECADGTGHASSLIDILFEKQDSLGLKRWASYATESGIASPDAFEECVTGDAPFPRIDDGLSMGERIGVSGTPTVIVNGWRYASPGDFASHMDQAIEAILRGDSPFETPELGRGLR